MLEFLKRHPYTVIIFKKDTLGRMTKQIDRARIFKDKSTQEVRLKMKKTKDELPPLAWEKAFVGNTLYLYSPAPHEYVPIDIDIKEGSFKLVDADLKMWFPAQVKKAYERHFLLSNWEKWLPIISVIIAAIGIGIMWLLATNHLKETADALNNVASNLGELIKLQQMALNKTQPTGLPPY